MIKMLGYFSLEPRHKIKEFWNMSLFHLFLVIFYMLFLKTSDIKCYLQIVEYFIHHCMWSVCLWIIVYRLSLAKGFRRETNWTIKNVHSHFVSFLFFFCSHILGSDCSGWRMLAVKLNVLFYFLSLFGSFCQLIFFKTNVAAILSALLPLFLLLVCFFVCFVFVRRRAAAHKCRSWSLDSLIWGLRGKAFWENSIHKRVVMAGAVAH